MSLTTQVGRLGPQSTQGPAPASNASQLIPAEQKVDDCALNALVPFTGSATETLEEKLIKALKHENYFLPEVKEEMVRMASLARLMYQDLSGLPAVSDLFPRALVLLKTPEAMGIPQPAGLKVQAFRHGQQVIIGIRGTELNKETATLLSNLIADAGIGRHKSNQDLIDSIKGVRDRALSVHGFKLEDKHMELVEAVINSRVEGHSDTERLGNMMGRLGLATGKGMAKGGLLGTIGGIILGSATIAGGLAAAPVALGVGVTVLAAGSLTGGATSTIQEGISLLTAADGYPTLLSYIQTIDNYIMALKAAGSIKESDDLITAGHSLGGWLAGASGALHADEIYAFNGPGVNFDEEIPALIKNMGKERSIQRMPAYHSISMETDFIGNLTRRSGGLKKLYLPVTSPEPCDVLPRSHYGSPLAHHGIDLILQVLKISSVSVIPLNRLPQSRNPMMLTDGPRIEEIFDEEEDRKQPGAN